ncbi:hypothetical protein ACTFIR_005738 [Dictyostelium discoideum]
MVPNDDKFSKRIPSDSASNSGERFPMDKNHAILILISKVISLFTAKAKAIFSIVVNPNHKTIACRVDPVDSKVNTLGQSAKKQQLLDESDQSKSKNLNKN